MSDLYDDSPIEPEAPVIKLARKRSVKIASPEEHFSGWAFDIGRHHWEVLGVTYRQFMKDRKPYMSWAVDTPPRHDFLEGTVFYRGAEYLQVVFSGKDGFVEVHAGTLGQSAHVPLLIVDKAPDLASAFPQPRAGWLLRGADLAEWLESGERPLSATAVDLGSSSCLGVMRYSLPKPSAGRPDAVSE